MPKDKREPLQARVSILMILFSIFLYVGLRNVDMLVVSLGTTLFSLVGMVTGYRSYKRIRRHGGRMTGENMARIGYWANLIIFVGSLFLFSYLLAMAILRGDIL